MIYFYGNFFEIDRLHKMTSQQVIKILSYHFCPTRDSRRNHSRQRDPIVNGQICRFHFSYHRQRTGQVAVSVEEAKKLLKTVYLLETVHTLLN